MIYFDNGATTFPKPKSVINAVNYAMNNCANPGRSGHRLSIKSSEIIYECRQNLAKLFDIDKTENVIFTNYLQIRKVQRESNEQRSDCISVSVSTVIHVWTPRMITEGILLLYQIL